MRRAGSAVLALAFVALQACAQPPPRGSTGGTDVEERFADGVSCGRGVVVVQSNYQASNVSLLGLDGQVLSSSFVSSASATVGLSAALSGDVVPAHQRAGSEHIVLIDRYPAAVLTWLDVRSAAVEGQLSVATGFASNPHDYLELSADKAYVTRFGSNPEAGRQRLDGGDDVLVLDPMERRVVSRVDLSEALIDAPGFFAHPGRMVRAAGRVVVLLSAYSQDFAESAASRLLAIDPSTDRVVEVLVLEGLHGCAGLALSPDERELAVSCSGEFRGTSAPSSAESAISLVTLGDRLDERARFRAVDVSAGRPLGFSVAYAAADRLVFGAFGRFAARGVEAVADVVLELDVPNGTARELLRSKSKPFVLGDVWCVPACAVCFVADAETDGGVVQRFDVNHEGQLEAPRAIRVAPEIGLPPRYLGGF